MDKTARKVIVVTFDEADANRLLVGIMDRDHPTAVAGMRLQPEECRTIAKMLRQAADKCDELRREDRMAAARNAH
jgi:uncharacterized membrane protein